MRRAVFVTLTAFIFLDGLPTGQAEKEPTRPAEAKKLRVAVVGVHLVDPESGWGGFDCRAGLGRHEIVVGYFSCFRGDHTICTEQGQGALDTHKSQNPNAIWEA